MAVWPPNVSDVEGGSKMLVGWPATSGERHRHPFRRVIDALVEPRNLGIETGCYAVELTIVQAIFKCPFLPLCGLQL